MVSRRALGAVLAVGAVAVGTGWLAGQGSRRASTGTGGPALGSSPVVRTTVVAREVVAGSLGYLDPIDVVAPVGEGVVTWLPSVGAIVALDERLYEVDGAAIVLWRGDRPAWRDLGPGLSGADVTQAESNLGARLTDPAIRRWQASHGLPPTGAIRLGRVFFAPGPLRVATREVSVGTPLAGGRTVMTATSTRKAVSVNLDPSRQSVVRQGAKVLIRLPNGHTANGTVAGIDAPVPESTSDSAGLVLPVTVSFDDPSAADGLDAGAVQVSLAVAEHANVLAVPIEALLAAVGGGYQVMVVSGPQRTPITVQCGLFDETGGLVEVTGALAEGMRVEVPAT
jgi:hypothetical protein